MDNCKQEFSVEYSEEFELLLKTTELYLDPGLEDYYELNKALKNGQKEVVKNLLENGARVNKDLSSFTSEDTCTPLHNAVKLGCLEIIKVLLDKGASINVKNNNQETPLIMAAKMEKYLIADCLLSVDNQQNCLNRENFSHMHIACMRNKVNVVKKLLQQGAKINHVVNSNSLQWPGFTPLHFAVKFQCVETVQFLLNCGADITVKDARTLTPLHYANILRNEEIIDLILSVHLFEFSNPINSDELSHFHIACTRNNPAVVEVFLKNGADINMRVSRESLNWNYYSPIDLAIDYECSDVIKLLLSYNATLRPNYLHYVSRTTNKEIIDLVLSKMTYRRLNRRGIMPQENFKVIPEDLNIKDETGFTPLHFAVKTNKEVAEILLKNTNSITVKDAKGKTPLHLAFESNLMNIVDMILSSHLNINENPTNNEGLSHFHISCIRGDLEIIKYFLKNGVDINQPANNNSVLWPGYTALHLATKFELPEAVKLLLNHDADITIKNENGLTALDIAINCTVSSKDYLNENGFTIIKAILFASSTQKTNSFDDRGFSLLHSASIIYDRNNIEHLLKFFPELINKAVNWPLEWCGYTPLHFALHFGNTEAAKLLISKGANLLAGSVYGKTPLHVAFTLLRFQGMAIEHSELFFTDNNPQGDIGFSHFHIACHCRNLKAVQHFLDRGVNINQPTKFTNSESHPLFCAGQTSLHLAINHYEYSKDVVQLLLDNGADIHARDIRLNTPLYYTKSNIDRTIAKILLAQGADINAQNIYGDTPLHYSQYASFGIFYPDPKKILFFLENGADVNIENENGQSQFMEIGKIPNEYANNVESGIVMMKHIKKLEIINEYISTKNKDTYEHLLKIYEKYYKESDFIQHCLEELQKMEILSIDKYTTLRSILKKNSNSMAFHSENVRFQNIINSNDFTTMFPIYGYLVRLQFEKGLARKPLLEISKTSLNCLMNWKIPMPDTCLYKILQYLTNKDLKNIVSSAGSNYSM